MNHFKLLSVTVLFGVAVVALPFTTSAQLIDVDPLLWDFGDVPVGTTVMTTVTITSTEPIPLRVESVEIIDDATSSFSILSEEAPPPTVVLYPQGETLDLEIAFTPSSAGMHSALLYIRSDAEAPDDNWFVPLQGVGTTGEPAPSELMANLIAFFDTVVEGGTIVGDGPGNSMKGRLRAFGNMLDAVADLIAAGDLEAACDQLQDAYSRADGESRPPDFIAGADREAIAARILEVTVALGCP